MSIRHLKKEINYLSNVILADKKIASDKLSRVKYNMTNSLSPWLIPCLIISVAAGYYVNKNNLHDNKEADTSASLLTKIMSLLNSAAAIFFKVNEFLMLL